MAATREATTEPAGDAESSLGSGTHVVFRVGTVRYALPVRRVLRVLPFPPVTRTPAAAAHMLGVFAHGGRAAALWDLHVLFGARDDPPRSPPVLLLETPEGLLGLAVTFVETVAHVGQAVTRAPRPDDVDTQALPAALAVIVKDASPPEPQKADDVPTPTGWTLAGATAKLARADPADLERLLPFALLDAARIVALGTGRPLPGSDAP